MSDENNEIKIRSSKKINKTGIFFGILIILFAFLWIATRLGLIPNIIFSMWPQIILIIIGIFILYKSL